MLLTQKQQQQQQGTHRPRMIVRFAILATTMATFAKAQPNADTNAPRLRIFRTRSVHSPHNFVGGIAHADAVCQQEAFYSDDTIMKHKARSFVAWLSGSRAVARERVHPFQGPYVLADGTTQIAESLAHLLDRGSQHAIDQDAAGEVGTIEDTNIDPAYATHVWTGTYATGMRDYRHTCQDWGQDGFGMTGRTGDWTRTGPGWTSFDFRKTTPCNTALAFYCFEQPLRAFATVYRIGSNSENADEDSDTMIDRDELCQRQAEQAGLAGIFRAWNRKIGSAVRSEHHVYAMVDGTPLPYTLWVNTIDLAADGGGTTIDRLSWIGHDDTGPFTTVVRPCESWIVTFGDNEPEEEVDWTVVTGAPHGDDCTAPASFACLEMPNEYDNYVKDEEEDADITQEEEEIQDTEVEEEKEEGEQVEAESDEETEQDQQAEEETKVAGEEGSVNEEEGEMEDEKGENDQHEEREQDEAGTAAVGDESILYTAFVTQKRFRGSVLGGMAGADRKCQREATEAGLTGTYQAWLANSTTTNPWERLGITMSPVVDYALVDGTLVANATNTLTTSPIHLTAKGRDILTLEKKATRVWTGLSLFFASSSSAVEGNDSNSKKKSKEATAAKYHCQDWKKVGEDDKGLASTTGSGKAKERPCHEKNRLYCFQTKSTTA